MTGVEGFRWMDRMLEGIEFPYLWIKSYYYGE